MTFEMRLKPNGGNGMILDSPSNGGDSTITINPDGSITGARAGVGSWATGPTYLFDGNWHHLALATDGSNWQVYLNGTSIPVSGSCSLYFGPGLDGTDSNLITFAGYIAEFRLWNIQCSAQQIATNMGLQLSPGQSGLVGLWNFSGQNANDATGTFNVDSGGSGGFQSTDLPVFAGSATNLTRSPHPARPRRARTGDTDPIAALLESFLSGAASQAGGDAAGYFLSLVGGGGSDPTVLSELNEIESQVTELLNDLKNDTNKIISTINWDTLVNTIRAPLADIDANWNDLLSGLDSSAQLADYVEVGTDLLQINQAIVPGGADPTSPGLLSDLVAMLLLTAVPVQQTAAVPRWDLQPLFTAYDAVQRYFHYLLGEQLRAITIVVNAVIFQKADPTTWITSFTSYIKAECAAFLSAVEQLVVSYCGDLTVLGLMTGPNIATNPLGAINPIGAADTYVSACLSPANYIFVRIWNGQGGGDFPFATGASVIGQDTPALSLVAASGSSAPAVASDPALSLTTTFPATSAGQWAVFRYAFALATPASGTNTWQLNSFPLGSFFNATVVWSTGFYHPFSGSAPQYLLQADGSGAAVSTALCNTGVF